MVDTNPLLSAFSSTSWMSWSVTMLPIMGLLTLFGVTFVYMLAYAFNIAQLKMWAKGQFMEVVVTFLIMMVLLQAVNLTWTLMVGTITNLYSTSNPDAYNQLMQEQQAQQAGEVNPSITGFDPFAYAQAYIRQDYIDCAKTIYRGLYPINAYYKLVGKTATEILGAEKIGGWSTTLYTGIMDYIVNNLSNLLLLQYIQIRFLSMVEYVMPMMMAIGLVLRALPPTRGAGGLLTALGFGFFVVYPISLALLTTFQAPPGSTWCTGFVPPAMLSLNNLPTGTDLGQILQARGSILASATQSASFLDKIRDFLPNFYLQALFFPLIALTVTWSFIREFAELLSGDLQEIGRGLIKLI